MGRKSYYEKWEDDGVLEDKLILMKGWARDGLTDKQISKNLDISLKVLYEYKNKFPHFRSALKKGKEIIDFEIENTMLKCIFGYDYEEVEQTKSIDKNGNELIHVKKTTKKALPNPTLLIFWLKTRQKEKFHPELMLQKERLENEKNNGSNVNERSKVDDFIDALNGQKR